MNKKVSKRLREIARSLPEVWINKTVSARMRGREILAENPDAHIINGEELHLDCFYVVRKVELAKLDVYEKLKWVYKRDGEHGVKQLAREVKLLAETQEGARKAHMPEGEVPYIVHD